MTNIPFNYRRLIIASIIIWTVIAVLGTFSSALYALSRDREILWGHLFWYKFSTSLAWMILTPILLRVTERFPLARIAKPMLITTLLFIGMLVAPTHRVISASIDYFTQSSLGYLDVPVPTFSEHLLKYFLSNTVQGIITYFVIISLIYGYQFYYQNLIAAMVQTKLESELSKAKLVNLQSQLNPHFLFNAMQSISSLMYQNIDKAERSMTLLSDLLRISFQRDDSKRIQLREELTFTNTYAELVKLRYGDRLELTIKPDGGIENCYVPPLLIQPFIENSIKHGLEKHASRGIVKVKISSDERMLLFLIEDNSPKSEETLVEGTGIKNTRSRLLSLYGKGQFSFSYCHNSDGFNVKIEIPIENE